MKKIYRIKNKEEALRILRLFRRFNLGLGSLENIALDGDYFSRIKCLFFEPLGGIYESRVWKPEYVDDKKELTYKELKLIIRKRGKKNEGLRIW